MPTLKEELKEAIEKKTEKFVTQTIVSDDKRIGGLIHIVVYINYKRAEGYFKSFTKNDIDYIAEKFADLYNDTFVETERDRHAED